MKEIKEHKKEQNKRIKKEKKNGRQIQSEWKQ